MARRRRAPGESDPRDVRALNLFLDTSVLLAACDSPGGGSRLIVEAAPLNGWITIASRHVFGEVRSNLRKFPPAPAAEWRVIEPRLVAVVDILAIDKPVVFHPTKDRPVLLSAYEFADVLITLDRRDFRRLLGSAFYHLRIFDPEGFLAWCRDRGTVLLPP